MAHQTEFQHSSIATMRMPSSGTGRPKIFVDGYEKLNFKLGGNPTQVRITYRYFPSDGTLLYQDVEYSDEKLQKTIEADPSFMNNIDSYLRRKLNDKTIRSAS